MDNSPAIMSSPSKALNPLSPERMNQQAMPPSPSLPSDIRSFHNKTRTGSDVQSKVAFLNGLSRGNSPAAAQSQPSAGMNTAALQRAILGREEAESALASANTQLSEAQSRERRLTERFDSLMEEYHTTKERQANERSVFEKEIRKARKEAFRAGSAVVKMQEELKHARAEVKVLKEEVHAEREAKHKARQEAFERAYALAGLTEELEVLKGRLRSVEANSHSDNLEAQAQRMNKEDIGRMSLAEGDLAMFLTPQSRRLKRAAEDDINSPLSNSADHTPVQQTPPKKQRLSEITVRPEDEDTEKLDAQHDAIEELKDILKQEKRQRMYAEDMLHFLEMECEFKRCACQFMQDEQADHVHGTGETTNKTMEDSTQHFEDEEHIIHEFNKTEDNHLAIIESAPKSPAAVDAEPEVNIEKEEQAPAEPLITFSPETGTFRAFPSPIRDNINRSHPAAFQSLDEQLNAPSIRLSASGSENGIESDSPLRNFSPTPTPMEAIADVEEEPEASLDIRKRDSTKTIHLQSEPLSSDQFAAVPGTPISREEALAQIRARRGRTFSMKRSISAGESALRSGGVGYTPVRTAKRVPGLSSQTRSENDTGRSRRDLSAPVRMLR